MKIAIRVDASSQIGTGHFMRCLTLANALNKSGSEVHFLSRQMPENLQAMLAQKGYAFTCIATGSNEKNSDGLAHSHWLGTSQSADAENAREAISAQKLDWLIVDHYALDTRWESVMRGTSQRIMVIDDLADRKHDCDLLLDQNYYQDLDTRYQGLVPDHCLMLLGPDYVLLRPEFADARQRLRKRDVVVKKILIFFGGSDVTNQTRKALDALTLLARPEIAVDVVVGAVNPHCDEIRMLCHEMRNIAYHCDVNNMAELIAAADLAVGAGGATTWERCALGLPSLTMVFADNQLRTTEDLEKFGAIEFLGWANEITAADLKAVMQKTIDNPALLATLSDRASLIMKKWQGTTTIVAAMQNL